MLDVVPMVATKKIALEYSQKEIVNISLQKTPQLTIKEDSHAGIEGPKARRHIENK